jgi:hypothetical protein
MNACTRIIGIGSTRFGRICDGEFLITNQTFFVHSTCEDSGAVKEYVRQHQRYFFKTTERRSRQHVRLTLYSRNLLSPQRDAIREAILRLGATCDITERNEYTRHELALAPACRVFSTSAPMGHIPRDTWQAYYDVRTGCPECWTGSLQNESLILHEFSPPTTARVLTTMHGHLLLHAELYSRITDVLSNGILRPVRARNGAPTDWYQVSPATTLPPFDATTMGLVRGTDRDELPCPVCRRDGHCQTRTREFVPVYLNTIVDGSGCTATWECFGKSRTYSHDRYVQALRNPRSLASAQC